MDMDKIIEISGLKKSFKDVDAVKGIDFYVEKGTLFAFLGPNGAGKSTTIDIISTLLEPDHGDVIIDGSILGKEDDKIRSVLGIVFQNSMLDELLTVKENLVLRGSLYHKNKEDLMQAIQKASECTGIKGFLNRPYGKLSGGQKRRADIARALVNTPKILILDEPTTGLDPQTRQNIWETIRQLQKENGITVFLTTHYMEEAAKADYVVVIDQGMIIAKGTPDELKEQYSSDSMTLTATNLDKIAEELKVNGLAFDYSPEELVIELDSTRQAIPIIERYKDDIISFQVMKGSMDDAFIRITGKEMRE
jgi:multidrug/hemolysin transport system ATP-binding protein